MSALWSQFRSRAFRRGSLDVLIARAATRTSLKRVLTFSDLVRLVHFYKKERHSYGS